MLERRHGHRGRDTHRSRSLVLILALLIGTVEAEIVRAQDVQRANGTAGTGTALAAPVIDVWNGPTQRFGGVGVPQRWVNIVGRVTADNGIYSLTYTLNGGFPVPLSWGTDTRRLARSGDFNIDIPYSSLASSNTVVITATDLLGSPSTKTVTVQRSFGNVWPRTYAVKWSSSTGFMDSAQVVDGKWLSGGGEVRIMEPGYDRILAIGDTTWTDYEVTTKMLVRWVDNSAQAFGDVSGGPAVGLIFRWNGHTGNPSFTPPITQPWSGYLPYGAIGWFHWRNYNFNGLYDRWELIGNNLQIRSESTADLLNVGVVYNLKMRVKTTPGVGGFYGVRVWEDGSAEPGGWTLTGQESLTDPQHGSFGLLAHHVDVSYGEVLVTPLGDVTTPVLVSPANGATGVVNGSMLVWQQIPTAAWYQLQVASDPSFTSGMVIDQSWIGDPQYMLSGLSSATTYYWRVRGYNPDGGSAFSTPWSFSTTLQPPSLASPANNALNQATSLTLRWNRVNGSTYGLQLATDSTFGTGIVIDESNLADTTRAVSGLAYGTRYFWRANAKNGPATSPYSTPYAFNTLLPPPAQVSPADQAKNLPLAITCVWRRVAGATGYRLQVSTDAGFATGMLVDDGTLTDTSRSVAGCVPYTRYYWRLQAKNAAGSGAFSVSRWFQTRLSTPALLSPSDGTGGMGASASLTWSSVSGAQTYQLQVATDPAFLGGLLVNDSTIVDTARTVAGLGNNAQYYWRVRARNADGPGLYTAAWSFSTLLSAPAQLSPANGTTNQPTTLSIRWGRVATATSYQLQLGTDSTFASGLIKNDSTITDTQRTVGGLTNGTRYFWRVRARNGGGGGMYASAWSFRTIGIFPSQVILVSPADNVQSSRDSVAFLWQRSTPSVVRYWLELSLDSVFTLRTVDSAVVDTHKTLRSLSDGSYWWRVRGGNAEGWGPFSQTRRLRVFLSDIAQTEGLPTRVALEQNYPNPFNPTTTITFELPRATEVRLEVYNPLGEVVSVLVDGHRAAGRHQVTFSGSGLSSGMYFCRLTGDQVVLMRKMLFVK